MSDRFRDELYSYVVSWLSDRSRATPPRSAGYRFMWSMVAPLDAAMDVITQGIFAAWPGLGTSTALERIGRSRGIIRGETEADDRYAARLRAWLDRWRIAGSAEAIARSLHEYLGNGPRVRVVSRNGRWVTINEDGSLERHVQAFDWDSVSNPERADYWSDIFIIIYPTQWAHRSNTFGDGIELGDDDFGIGHDVNVRTVDEVKSLLNQWKSAHSRVRVIVWTSDETLFNPEDPGSLPNGNWGSWGSGLSRVASDRDLTSCRYWEM